MDLAASRQRPHDDRPTEERLKPLKSPMYVVSLFTFSVAVHGLQVGSAVFFFMGAIYTVHYKVYDSQVATLKEIKQVQLQILELQASLRKDQ